MSPKSLGYVAWWAIPDVPVKLDRLRREWRNSGLEDVMPAPPVTLYGDKRRHVPGPRLRRLVRETFLNGLYAEALRGKSGGVYFVPNAYSAWLTSIEQVLGAVVADAYLDRVELRDQPAARILVRRHHVENTLDALAELIDDLDRIASSDRTPRHDSVEFQTERLHTIEERVTMYGKIIGRRPTELDIALGDARAGLGSLHAAVSV